MNMISTVLSLLLLTVAQAQDSCSCPVIECDPCQTKLLLEEEEKACESGQNIVCPKMVCENVDNYFQCLNGEAASYVPPQDLENQLTTPRDLKSVAEERARQNEKQVKSIYGYTAEEAPDIEVRELTLSGEAEPQLKSKRSIASVDLVAPQVDKTFKVKNFVGNKRTASAKKIRYSKSLPLKQRLNFKAKDRFEIQDGQARAFFEFTHSSNIQFRVQQETLVVFLESGGVDVRLTGKWGHPLVFDLNQWRAGKGKGKISLFWHQGNLHVKNKVDILWLRKDELISKAQKLEEGLSFQVSNGQDLIAFSKQTKTQSMKLPTTLVEVSKQDNDVRQPANANSICSAPQGEYQQCAWKCFGNGNKDKKCRAEKESINCVRFTCTIDGFWKLPTLSPGSHCPAQGARVGRCL